MIFYTALFVDIWVEYGLLFLYIWADLSLAFLFLGFDQTLCAFDNILFLLPTHYGLAIISLFYLTIGLGNIYTSLIVPSRTPHSLTSTASKIYPFLTWNFWFFYLSCFKLAAKILFFDLVIMSCSSNKYFYFLIIILFF